MLEVMRLLRREGFQVWIVTGGGQNSSVPSVRRPTTCRLAKWWDRSARPNCLLPDGRSELFRLPEIEAVDDGPGKPIGIGRFIGRRPIIAFGNSDGERRDVAVHDDEPRAPPGRARCTMMMRPREYAYDRDTHIGKLDRGLVLAPAAGWTLVSMKNDWLRIFPGA